MDICVQFPVMFSERMTALSIWVPYRRGIWMQVELVCSLSERLIRVLDEKFLIGDLSAERCVMKSSWHYYTLTNSGLIEPPAVPHLMLRSV